MPISMRTRSKALDLRFFSLKTIAPNRKLTITLLRRIIDTTDIMASGSDKAHMYTKSAAQRKMLMHGIVQLQRKGVVPGRPFRFFFR